MAGDDKGGHMSKSNLVTHDINGRPLRWRDEKGVMHAVELAPPRPDSRAIGAWWTRCGSWNISRTEAWGGQDSLTCKSCSAIERGI
jgi:hypothetical protein